MNATVADQERLPEGARQELPKGTPLIARLWHRSTHQDSGCYQWRGSLCRGGYGKLKVDGRTEKTHRVAYEHFVGPIPEGMELDHLCRNRACWNPQHLEPVTGTENTERGYQFRNKNKTHCVHGHELSGDNLQLIVRPTGRFHRRCITCRRETNKRYNEKRVAK